MPSAVASDDMHMSKNCVCTIPRLSYVLMVSAFIFSIPVSVEPSIASKNGVVFIVVTSFDDRRVQLLH